MARPKPSTLKRLGITEAEYDARMAEYSRTGKKSYAHKCTLCDITKDLEKFFGKKYCKRHMAAAKRLHYKFTHPVGRYGAKSGG